MRIDVPEYNTFVDFPDDMSPEDIQSALTSNFPPKSAGPKYDSYTPNSFDMRRDSAKKMLGDNMLRGANEDMAANPQEAVLTNTTGVMEPYNAIPHGKIATAKRLAQSGVKGLTTLAGSLGNILEGDTQRVNRGDVGAFGTDDTGYEMDESGNMVPVRTAPNAQIIKEQEDSLSATIGRSLQYPDKLVKSPEYDATGNERYAGMVLENLPRSTMYMLPNLLPGGGAVSNAMMYQDTYLQYLKELRKAREEGKIDLDDNQIEEAAVKRGIYEAAPEMLGNAAEAGIIKYSTKFASRFVPMGQAPTVISNLLNKIKGAQTGTQLFEDVFAKSAIKRFATVGGATAAAMPMEAGTEMATEWFQANQDIDLGLVKVPAGTSREEFVKSRLKDAGVVGALSGGAMTGAITGLDQVGQKRQATKLQTDLFAPVDTTAENAEAKMEERQEAGKEMIAVIQASGLSKEEKAASVANIVSAIATNKSIPFSPQMFQSDSITAGMEFDGADQSALLRTLSPGSQDRMARQSYAAATDTEADVAVRLEAINERKESTQVPDMAIGDDNVSVDDVIAAASAEVNSDWNPNAQNDLLNQIGGSDVPTAVAAESAPLDMGATPQGLQSQPGESVQPVTGQSVPAAPASGIAPASVDSIIDQASRAVAQGKDYPAFAKEVADTHGFDGVQRLVAESPHATLPEVFAASQEGHTARQAEIDSREQAIATLQKTADNIARPQAVRQQALVDIQTHQSELQKLRVGRTVPSPSLAEPVNTPAVADPSLQQQGETEAEFVNYRRVDGGWKAEKIKAPAGEVIKHVEERKSMLESLLDCIGRS